MMQEMWNGPPGFRPTKSAPSSPAKMLGVSRTRSESFHVAHKVPVGDTPYVRAKNVQLVDKDPERAIPLFWAAINAGDRVDSALKDMAIVMKQQNRAEEAIEAIKSLRSRCSDQAQESLDNILLDLYKRCGRLDDQIALLRHKLYLIQQGMAFNGKRTKTARSQGKKFQVSVEQEATRLLGNLGWALMQQNNYIEAEEAYRRALLLAPDNNKMCNLGICLMKQGRIAEAKETLRRVKPAVADGPRGVDSHLKAYERAQQMLRDLESEMLNKVVDRVEQSKLFDAFLGSSAIWQPQPCKEHTVVSSSANNKLPSKVHDDVFVDENANSNIIVANNSSAIWQPHTRGEHPIISTSTNNKFPSKLHNDVFTDENINSSNIIVSNNNRLPQKSIALVNSLNIDAPPFYSSKLTNDSSFGGVAFPESLKRTRSENVAQRAPFVEPENKVRRQLIAPEKKEEKWDDLLPDNKDFEEAIVAAVLGPDYEKRHDNTNGIGIVLPHKKVEKRLKVFQDITQSLSPRVV
ncbi:hypothetical protein CDL12_26561 [Handroanthus impetiginosus]|uniref:Uncharacterized protein n=1 Tax=Handroanthus impetiginosus TaxID=429701 RepID=A0A2G9G7J4_9LAMI|nr:hypothetical protein CDL12_26561 [Handroanthus impetiginosus]